MAEYKKVKVEAGPSGWGGPLEVAPDAEKKYVVCITGGGIHPVAQKIADMTGAEAFDGFKSSPEGSFKAMACAVIDCGGTARIGVYPMKGFQLLTYMTPHPLVLLHNLLKKRILYQEFPRIK